MTITDTPNYAISLGAGSTPAAPNNDLGKDAFLQLLVTQLQNQDPTNPQDGGEFVAQLATFSQVEQLTTMNDSIGYMSGQLSGQNDTLIGILGGIGAIGSAGSAPAGPSLVQAAALIGRTAEAPGAQAYAGGGESGTFSYRLAAESDVAEVTIRDASGNVVRTIALDSQQPGEHTLSFDGKDADGNDLPQGAYTATINGLTAAGKGFNAEMFTRGEITRVGQQNGVLSVWMGRLRVSAGSLSSVG